MFSSYLPLIDIWFPLFELITFSGNFHLSLSSQLADLFQIRRQARQDVLVRVVSTEAAALNFVELSFKDQYISRGDMLRCDVYY